jgi:hypothetical protein
MVLEPRQTTVAYRCPQCGAGVMSVVNLFNLCADMIKLKCDCGGSEMTLVHTKDQKVRFTVPCIFCPNPHHFTLSSHSFFEKEMFALPCPYSGMNVAVMGDTDRVKAELARSELELLELLEENNAESFSSLHKEQGFDDPQVLEIITYIVKELDAEGRINCLCESDGEGDYELEFFDNIAKISCKRCGCKKEFKTDSISTSQELLSLDKLKLEF